MHKGSRAHEQADLDDAVKYHMRQTCLKPLRRQCHGPQQHVGQITHCGIRQPPLEVALPQSLNGAEEKRKNRKRKTDRLCCSPPQIIRPEDEIGHAHYGEDARIDHRHRVQKRCDRSRSDRRRRQPVVQREYRRFGPESDEAQHECQLHHGGIIAYVDASAVFKDSRHAEHCCQDHRHKAQGSASDGVSGVLAPRVHTLVSAIVRHERDRNQRQHFDEYIHRDHVRRVADAQRHAVGHHIKGKKAIAPFVTLHILESIQKDQRPHQGDHDREHIRHAVHAEVHRKPAGEAVDRDRIALYPKGGRPDTGRRQKGHDFAADSPFLFFFQRSDQHRQSARNGQQDRDQQKYRAQDRSPPVFCVRIPVLP